MRLLSALLMLALAVQLGAQPLPDETAIRNIIADENATWNNGDPVGYSGHFAEGAHSQTSEASFSPGMRRSLSNMK